MTHKIAICDDDSIASAYIKTLVEGWAADHGIPVSIRIFPSAEAFLFHYADHKEYDILLLDIEMGEINGIELAKNIRKDNESAQIIFITGYSDFIAEGYEVSALHYLLKPVSSEKLRQVLDKPVRNLAHKKKALFIPVDSEMIRIILDDIQYVEAFDHRIEIVTADNTFLLKLPLHEMEHKLNEDFIRIHRGCIVNLHYIKRITRTDIVLDSGKTLPVSRRMYASVNRAIMKYCTGGMES